MALKGVRTCHQGKAAGEHLCRSCCMSGMILSRASTVCLKSPRHWSGEHSLQTVSEVLRVYAGLAICTSKCKLLQYYTT